ncbi:Major facilitator superfamily (MFS) transporter [Candidatus Sulfotelmatobacter kueseliae]|uniref:Lysosomal dipeptide transporter MFSD1 n=1 Tax=Candidatus Sulfotelmatobacter kueseliae TaxID=2042962 RepID=A0A2U3KDX2_9BACT|nr:Major facilitator superfamily (MFS) transporter [Candidatus Sulfotelmatobacter kueseliae]
MHATTRPEPSRLYRWMVLLFLSLAMFGSYYAYDALSPLADVLKQQLRFSDENIGLLQAIYSFPNIFTVVIGGFIIDRLGLRKSLMIFGVLCLVGPAITASSGHLSVMAAGRLIFGMGAESLNVAVTAALARWFKGKELSFAFGINLTICRLGSFAALNSPTWARAAYANWRWPFLIALALSVFCVVGAIVYWIMEAQAEKNFHLGEASTDKVVFADLFKFGVSYWYIVALCVTFYSAIFPFQTFAVKFFIEAHGTSREFGGFLSSMLTLFAMIATPLFGLWVDRVGKRAMLMMFGSLLLVPVYLMMAYTHVNLYVPMALMGVAFSLIPAVMWPSVAYIVDQSKLGTAYGLMTMIQNIGLFGFNLMVGWANDYSHAGPDNPGGYHLGMWIFSTLGFLGLGFAFLLRQRELSPHGHGLETITTATHAS